MPSKFKLPDNLPNQAAEIKRLDDYAQTGRELKAYTEFMAAKMKLGQEEYYSKNPNLKTKLGYYMQGRAYVKRPGSHVVMPKIVEHLLFPNGLTKTKAAILREVKEKLPNQAAHTHDNIWYRPIKPAMWTKLQTFINCSTKPVSIRGCRTLGEIRDRLIAFSVAEAATFSEKITISIDKDNVVIGKNIFHIVTNLSKEKKYRTIRIKKNNRQHSLNVDVLRMFLQKKG